MPTAWLFIDEHGDVNFGRNTSPFFALGSIVTADPTAVAAVVEPLRHAWWSSSRIPRGYFHAKNDCWPVRKSVYALSRRHP